MASDTSTPPTHDLENLRLINHEISARYDRLSDSSSRLDTKATTLVGFVLAAATFLAAHPGPAGWRAVAFVTMAVAAAFGFAALLPRKHKDAPEPAPLWQYMAARSEQATLAVVVAAKIKAFKANHETHERKALCWRGSLIALTLSIILTVTTLAIGSG